MPAGLDLDRLVEALMGRSGDQHLVVELAGRRLDLAATLTASPMTLKLSRLRRRSTRRSVPG
jgi:hypothetical protein